MKNTNAARPSLTVLSHVKSSVHLCNDAVLVRLSHGKSSLRCVADGHENYSVLLNDAELCYAHIPSCGTCGDMLMTGYGIENLGVDELSRIRDTLNGEYPGIERAAESIAPLVGLLKDGYYLIADYELYPTLDGKHFWNGDYRSSGMLHDLYAWGGTEIFFSPAYLAPSQSPKAFSEDTVRRYINRLPEGRRFPRAVAYYLSGCVALLLDGHHKAAATAYAGQTVKCLVILPVEDTHDLINQAGRQRLLLEQDGYAWNPYRFSKNGVCGFAAPELVLCGGDGTECGRVCDITQTADMLPQATLDTLRSARRNENESWGQVPSEYCGRINEYPDDFDFSQATFIPRNRIREEYSTLIHNVDPGFNALRCRCLMKYYEVFPSQKWITERMYGNLVQLSEKQWDGAL